jgi:hypothetical protein
MIRKPGDCKIFMQQKTDKIQIEKTEKGQI